VTPPAPELNNPLAGGSDHCPNCGASLAPDQRYCLACGHRRGDPRLPFMDAVAFMESSKRGPQPQSAAAPAPAPDRRPFMSANASLVAGVATLVLAIGVGVLIGRSGDSGAGNAAAPAPQIIRVGGGEGSEVASDGKANESKGSIDSGGGPKTATKKRAKAKTEQGKSGASKATEEVYEPAAGIKIAPPEQQIGGECDPSVAGCGKNGKFEGTFFE
jgi:zinc-ribbon domain